MSSGVSIVIPTYNVAPYLAECLDSILGQNISEMQVICVDDGSTDDTIKILAEYATNHAEVLMIEQTHGGQSTARNNGLKYVTGKYVMFCDADDLLAEEALSTLATHAEEVSADIVYFDADSFYESEELRHAHPHFQDFYHRKQQYSESRPGAKLLVDMLKNGDWRSSTPLQFYRTDFLNQHHLAFIPGIIHEDNAFSYRAALAARTTSHINAPLYLRRVRAKSTMTTKEGPRNVIGYFTCYKAMLQTAEEIIGLDQTALNVPYDMLTAARNIYRTLALDEQHACIEAFEGADRIAFHLFVEKDSDLLCAIDNKQREIDDIKNSRRYKLAEKLANVHGALSR